MKIVDWLKSLNPFGNTHYSSTYHYYMNYNSLNSTDAEMIKKDWDKVWEDFNEAFKKMGEGFEKGDNLFKDLEKVYKEKNDNKK